MKKLSQTKFTATKILVMVGILLTGFHAQAQKVGDNLGNHTANQNLKMSGNDIVNAANVTATGTATAATVAATNMVTSTNGVVIGAAAFTNGSVSLELNGTTKAMLITRVADLLNASTIANPLDGMMVYNNNDGRFYFRNSGVWETFASSPNGKAVLSITAGPLLAASNNNGFSLLNGSTNIVGPASGNLTLSLQPADDLHPGIVTIDPQIFSGSKTFGGNLFLGSVMAQSDTSDKVLVRDGSGQVRMSTSLTAGMIQKTTYAITNAQAVIFSSPNMYSTLTIPVTGIKKDDGVVVNFFSADLGLFDGLTIKNAAASADNIVTVQIEDDRNPADDPAATPPYVYTLPKFSLPGARLMITWLHAK